MVKLTDIWIDPQLMDSHQRRKHKRIMAIARVIEMRGRVNHKRFLAEIQYNGLRRCVSEEYLKVLKDLELVKCDNSNIIWNGKDENDLVNEGSDN